MKKLTIATRQSKLALWQTHHIKDRLEALHPGLNVELLGITAQGDKILDVSLTKIGGKALFVKELEKALLDGRADIAAHSLKDVPMFLPDELCLPVICERHDPSDILITRKKIDFKNLPDGFVMGTSSMRRQCQLLHAFPNLEIKLLRGNVDTRIRKLNDGEYDGIVLAKAGVERLGIECPNTVTLSTDTVIPCAGQGAIGIECRNDRQDIQELIQPLHDANTAKTVLSERAVVRTLNGDCKTPIGAYATLDNEMIYLKSMVGTSDGSNILMAEGSGLNPEQLGEQIAEALLDQGAGDIIHG